MKVNFYLKAPQADYETWIFCMISYQGKRVKVYTDKKINPQFWNSQTQRARQTSKFPINPEFNSGLIDIVSFVNKIELDWKSKNNSKKEIPPVPSQILKEGLRKYLSKTTKDERDEGEKRTFWGYYDTFLKRMENGTRVHIKNGTPMAPKTIFQFHNLKRHLISFEVKCIYELDFESIDLTFYKKFTDYLTKKQLAPNTIGKLVTNLKVFLREALEDGLTNNTIFTHRKFKSISFKSDTVYLTNEEITALQQLDLSGQARLEKVRDVFIIGCYTGLRFSDLNKIEPNNIENGMVELVQTKTGNQVIIPLRKDVVHILEKYSNKLPKISNQKFNKYLNEVCQKCPLLEKETTINFIKGGKSLSISKPKYEFISSHTARRSFATNEFRAGDLDISEIMKQIN